MDQIPKFLNGSLDDLARSLFDLIGNLFLKMASIDDHIDQAEEEVIKTYLIEEWGYDETYLDYALKVIKNNINRVSVDEMAEAIARFAKKDSNCNFTSIKDEILSMLKAIAEADGRIDDREQAVIQ